MSIARMSKVSLVIHASYKDKLLDEIQKAALLHITEMEKETEGDFSSEDKKITELETTLGKLDRAISFIRPHLKQGGFLSGLLPQKLPVLEDDYKKTLETFDYKEMVKKVESIDSKISQLRSEKETLLAQKQTIEPWLPIDTPIELLNTTDTTFILPGRVSKRALSNDIKKRAEEMGVEIVIVNETKTELFVILLFHKSIEPEARSFLDEINFNFEDLKGLQGKPSSIYKNIVNRLEEISKEMEELQKVASEFVNFYKHLLIVYEYTLDEITRLKAAKESVKTKTTYIIQGWVETKRKEILRKLVESYNAAIMVDTEPEKGERPPVKLINRKFFKPFEIVTLLYGNPQYNELDPSPFLALFFAVFFGLCLTDAGYGIILALIALLLMKKMPEGKKFLWLIFIGAMFTILEGGLLGGWFGNLFNGTFLEKPVNALMIFDPMKSYFVFFRLALLLGAIQIYLGLFIKLYEDIKTKNYADAFFEEVVWIILLSSLAVMLFSKSICIQLNLTPKVLIPESFFKPSLIVAMICGLIVIFFGARDEKNPFFRLLIGVLRLFILGGIFSFIGDFLSYIRLMALGLVTAGIANAINDIAKMTLSIPVLGIILFAVILIFGHLFNIGINTLGGFVHTLRLQYVEFFQKFFIGGGKMFTPLKRNEKFILLKRV